ncbi:MAG: Fur family transcriptional regulator [Candidatus Hodarchaeales archaeon]|jgi:Fur family peroxide stress response transcriptional regulator
MNNDYFIAKLRELGYKVTPQRLTIFETVLPCRDHPTAEQIYQRVVKSHPTISMATVYHTLHLLGELGLVQELGLSEGRSRFDPNTNPHINIICPTCGDVYDYMGEHIEQFWSQIVSKLDVKPIGQRMDLYALCKKCLTMQTK